MPFGDDIDKTKEWGSQGGIAKAAIYDLDRLQIESMKEILNKDLETIKRIQNQEEINPIDEKKLSILQSRVLKIYDKLHATKTTNEHTGNLTISVEKEIQEKYANTEPEINSEGQAPIQSS